MPFLAKVKHYPAFSYLLVGEARELLTSATGYPTPVRYKYRRTTGQDLRVQLALTRTMADRLSQVSGHLSNKFPRGLVAGEVVIITGGCLCQHEDSLQFTR